MQHGPEMLKIARKPGESDVDFAARINAAILPLGGCPVVTDGLHGLDGFMFAMDPRDPQAPGRN